MPPTLSLWVKNTMNPQRTFPFYLHLTSSLICPYQKYVTAMFNYPLYPALYNGFGYTNASLAPIPSTAQSNNQSGCTDSGLLGTFIENADLSRFWNETSDPTLGKNAIAYVILAEGIPFVYFGFETLSNGAYPNYNRDPLWPAGWQATDMSNFVGTLNKFRNGVINKDGDIYLKGGMLFVYSAGNAVVFQRGPVLVFLTNGGSEAANFQIETEKTNYEQGTVLTEIVSGGNVTVGSQGVVSVTITKGMPQVYYPASEYVSVTTTTMVTPLTPISTGLGGPSASISANPNSNSSSSGKKSSASGRMGGEIHMWLGIFTIFAAALGGLMVL
jgi:alpha-amylase